MNTNLEPEEPSQAEDSAKPCVLVVDDTVFNRELIRASLDDEFLIRAAESGKQALAILDVHPVDLVLLDVMMPGLDGYETCRRIKAREGLFLPVVLLTALNEYQERATGLEAGADDFLSKPVDHRELRVRIRALIRLRRQQEQIREQLAELRHLQLLKEELFSLIVHDIRNPLSGVVAYLDLIQNDLSRGDTSEVEEMTTQALKAAGQVGRLLEGVLEIQRLEEADLPLELRPVDLTKLLDETRAALAGVASSRGIHIDLQVEEGIVGNLDAALLRRAVENLLSNAIRVTAQGGRTELRAHRSGSLLVVEVADRGPGLSGLQKQRALRKYGRGDGTRGFGLGLHLVKLVAEAHQGELSLRDREGGGLTASLSLESGAD